VIRSQSGQSRRTVPTQRSANAFACGARNGGADDLDALVAKDLIERAREFTVAGLEPATGRSRELFTTEVRAAFKSLR
jgi:hypothetical protein